MRVSQLGQPTADPWEALGGEAWLVKRWQEEIGKVAAPGILSFGGTPRVELPGVEQLSQ